MPGVVMRRWSPSMWVSLLCVVLLAVVIKTRSSRREASNETKTTLPAITLTTDQAKNHIGENATVCGVVVSVGYVGGGRTFVDLDKDSPHQPFAISIWAEDKFSPEPRSWVHNRVCVTGIIRLYLGSPTIEAYSPQQISVK